MIKSKAPIRNDGFVKIYSVENVARPGAMPKEGLILKIKLRLHQRTVGIARYNAGLQNKVEIDSVIRCLLNRDVSTQDVAVINNERQFRIVQIQYIEGIVPMSMDLSLERIEAKYEIN